MIAQMRSALGVTKQTTLPNMSRFSLETIESEPDSRTLSDEASTMRAMANQSGLPLAAILQQHQQVEEKNPK